MVCNYDYLTIPLSPKIDKRNPYIWNTFKTFRINFHVSLVSSSSENQHQLFIFSKYISVSDQNIDFIKLCECWLRLWGENDCVALVGEVIVWSQEARWVEREGLLGKRLARTWGSSETVRANRISYCRERTCWGPPVLRGTIRI